ncbi:MAG: galactokinase [Candidatus Marinimicrobia bacterium]|nr:galactokinase [Candidatus Neomarinimicrobiota bacterium]|tara:strand:+ start:95008 stop:95727 length:720 start_codon:yes stop_codon:yes gene_type:complete
MTVKIKKIDLSNIDTVILAGGFGTRLRGLIDDKPKCMAKINGKPFIDILIDKCMDQRLKRFIICVGYLKEQVIEHLDTRNDCKIIYSKEEIPLGTGGAVKNTEGNILSKDFFVINGDSYSEMDFASMLMSHKNNKGVITIGIAKQSDSTDFGTVTFNKSLRITGFSEKGKFKNEYINAGVYLFKTDVFKIMPKKQTFSIEKDFFEKIYEDQSCYVFTKIDNFIDIGTKQRYYSAHENIN